MQILSARHVKPEESLRLGVVSGWYSTKVSGTFVTGPHTTQEDCLSKILELNPVSYTHLDVYKRQISSSAMRCTEATSSGLGEMVPQPSAHTTTGVIR